MEVAFRCASGRCASSQAVLFRFRWLYPAAPGLSVLFRAPLSTKSGFLGSSSNFVLSSYASLEDFNPKESVRSATIHTSLDTFHLVIQTLNQSIAY